MYFYDNRLYVQLDYSEHGIWERQILYGLR